MENKIIFFLLLQFFFSKNNFAQSCNAYAGTTSVTVTNGFSIGNHYYICYGGAINIVSNNDFILPSPGCATGCSSRLMYALYTSGGPTTNDPATDTNWTGYLWTGQDFISSNAQGLNISIGDCSGLFVLPLVSGYASPNSQTNTFVFVPITGDAQELSAYDADGDGCFDLGTPIIVTFLNPISFNSSPSCNGSVTVQLEGGYPEFSTGVYSLTNTGAGNLSSISINSGGSVTISNLLSGQSYSFNVNDGTGCIQTFSGIYSGSPSVSINPSSATICSSISCANLTATINSGIANGNVTFTNNNCALIPDGGIGVTNGNPTVVVGNWASSTINISGFCGTTWSTGQTLIVCLNINHTYDGDLNIYIQSPNGVYYLLSDDNGVAGDNYTNTCFTASASTVIPSGASNAPFSGSYKPEGTGNNFGALNGTQINGVWTLWIADDVVSDPGTLLNWSITFSNQNTYTFSWSPASGLSSTNTLSPIACPNTNTTYTLTVTNSCGCFSSATSVINILNNLTINVPPATICNGNSVSLTATGATDYTWSPSTGLTITTGNTVIAQPTTTTTYTVNGSSGGGCGYTTVIVTVSPLPNVIVNSASFCFGGSALLTAIGASTYSWTPNTALNNTTGSIVTANPSSTISYTVTGINSSTGCINTATSIVTVNPIPDIQVDSLNICTGSSGILTATGASSFTWNPSTGLSASTGSAVTANPTITTTYTIIGTQVTGCSNSTSTVVTVGPLNSPISVLNDTIFCGGIATISAIPANGGNMIQWYNSSSGGSPISTSLNYSNSFDTTTTLYAASYNVNNGCESDLRLPVFVVVLDLNKPISSIDATVCESGEAMVSAMPSMNGNTIRWYTDSIGGTLLFEGLGYSSNYNESEIIYASTYNIQTGCESIERLPVAVFVYPLPLIESTVSNATYGNTGSIYTSIISGQPPYSYDWSNDGTGDYDDSSFLSNLTEGIYYLTVVDIHGCRNSVEFEIANGQDLFVPTGFSPNADGINDTWEILGAYQYEDITVSIFNLQGQLLYFQNKNYIPWDGKYKWVLVPVGDYYFVIESLNHKRKQTGTLTIKY